MNVDPWGNIPRAPAGPGGTINLVEGSTFLVSDLRGDILPGSTQGLFHRDTRFLYRLELRVDENAPEPLAAKAIDPYSARFVLRVPWESHGESPIVLMRNRFVADGLHEDVVVTNHGLEPVELSLEIRVDADFADLFDVKALGGERKADATRNADAGSHVMQIEAPSNGTRRATEVRLSRKPDEITGSGSRYQIRLEPQQTWRTCLAVCLSFGDQRCVPKFDCDAFGTLAAPLARRAHEWREAFPELRSASGHLEHLYQQGVDDLASLLMRPENGSQDLVVAAGLPWFMTLFGRDALLTALMVLPFDQELPRGVLRTLARHQGQAEDGGCAEQPGKILHEMRYGELALRGGQNVYYGSVDATPLFVILAAEARRWGLAWSDIQDLLPHVRAALGWMRDYGDSDGDGYLDYPGQPGQGLRNQGWKDSPDAIQFRDGRLAEGPIALAEVQGYAYRARLDRPGCPHQRWWW